MSFAARWALASAGFLALELATRAAAAPPALVAVPAPKDVRRLCLCGCKGTGVPPYPAAV